MKKLALIGVGGHGDALLPYINQEEYQLVGYFDDKNMVMHNDLPVLGKVIDVISYLDTSKIDAVFIAIGDNIPRFNVFKIIAEKHYDKLINIFSPEAKILSPELIKGKGIFIGHDAFVGAQVEIHDNVILNTRSIVEHNSVIYSHSNVAPAALVLGHVIVGEGVHVGASATIKQVLSIHSWSTIGACTLVVKDIKDRGTYVGIPARKLNNK